MRDTVVSKSNSFTVGLLGLAIAVALGACNSKTSSHSEPTPVADTSGTIDSARIAELDARAQQLAQREAELAAKEQEESAREQAVAEAGKRQREAAANAAAAKKAAMARASSKNVIPISARVEPAPPPAPPPPIQVPAGTALTMVLSSDLSTKTNKPGDAFESRLVSDLMMNDRRVALAGSRVTGTITDVVSGSNAIGAVPRLALKLDYLELSDGQRIPISGELVQDGKSEKARDAAKILGGAAAGAVIGHQVKDNDRGKIIGGLLGGAAGAVAAKKTGTEVQLPAGSTLTITLGQAFQVAGT